MPMHYYFAILNEASWLHPLIGKQCVFRVFVSLKSQMLKGCSSYSFIQRQCHFAGCSLCFERPKTVLLT